MVGSVIAVYVGGPRCGRTCEVSPDAAPAEIHDHGSEGLYRLTEAISGPVAFPARNAPVYAYEPPRAAAERSPVAGGCRCGCRRTGVAS